MIFAALVIGILVGLVGMATSLILGSTFATAALVYVLAGVGAVFGICVFKALACSVLRARDGFSRAGGEA